MAYKKTSKDSERGFKALQAPLELKNGLYLKKAVAIAEHVKGGRVGFIFSTQSARFASFQDDARVERVDLFDRHLAKKSPIFDPGRQLFGLTVDLNSTGLVGVQNTLRRSLFFRP